MAFVLGGVFSQKEGFTSLAELIPGLTIHTVCMALGLLCLTRTRAKKSID